MRYFSIPLLGLMAFGIGGSVYADPAPDTGTPSVIVNTPSVEPSEAGRIMIPAIPGVPKIFLPDIGIAGDFAFQRNNLSKTDPRYSASDQQPQIRDGQAVFFSPIDPYTNAQFTIDLPHDGNATISEAWVYFNKLPGQTSVRVGRFAPKFGLIDVLNTFQLPFVDRPNAIADYVGAGGITATGLEANAYIPNPWDAPIKLNVNAAQGDALMGPSDTLDLTYLATLDYSSDLLTAGTMQAGASVAQGPSPYGRSETLVEPYLQLQFAPTQRKIWTWWTEGMLAQRRGLGANNNKNGVYSFLDYNFALRYHLGFLADLADQPEAPYGQQLGIGPNATYFLSDNLRFRAQYTHTTALANERPEEKVALQVTFSLGNLKQMN